MKKLILVFAFLLFSSTANATLIDNLDGTITQIRSDGSALMWLQDANYAKTSGYAPPYTWNDSTFFNGEMSWQDAMAWTDSLIFAGHSDWRLPNVLPVNGTSYNRNFSFDGSSDIGYNITSLNSEMGYMFYVELGNVAFFDTNGAGNQAGWTRDINTSLFTNLQSTNGKGYWTNNDVYDVGSPGSLAWDFSFDFGGQRGQGLSSPWYAWAVRDITVDPIPEPTTIALLGIGLVGLAGVGVRRRFKKVRK